MSVEYDNVPSAVFSQPPIGTVGLTEVEARRRYGEIDIYKANFRPLRHTMSGRDERSFMKLIVDRKSDRVVGCHMIGTDAGEIVQGLAVALQCGATKAQFDATIAVHPTAAEEFVTMREKVLPEAMVTFDPIEYPRASKFRRWPVTLELCSTSVEPVKAPWSVSGCDTRAAPIVMRRRAPLAHTLHKAVPVRNAPALKHEC